MTAQGSFDQTQFETLEGCQPDRAGEVRRFGCCVATEAGSLYFGMGIAADGNVKGLPNYPWARAEYHHARGDEPVSRIKLFIDDKRCPFSSLKLLDGCSCRTPGSKAYVIPQEPARAQAVKVTICFYDETRDFHFGAAALKPPKSWCDAVSGERIDALLDQKLLPDIDEISGKGPSESFETKRLSIGQL